MNSGRTIFAQLTDYLSLPAFRQCVERYKGDHRVHNFSCYDQFLCLVFAQLTYRESLRDIEACLRVAGPKLYHMGFRCQVSRNTLAKANENRDWRIYADFAMVLIQEARKLYATEAFGVNLKRTAYALDATTIDLCLSVFPWAKFRDRKGGVKTTVLLALRGNIPVFVHICPANTHEVKVLDLLSFEAGAFYIVDRGYLDFTRLHRLHESRAFFITRAKKNFAFKRRVSRPVKTSTGVQFDQTVTLSGFNSALGYPEPLRRIGYLDPGTGKHLIFLTNNFDLSPLTIARLYKQRWQVELFFKWLKQHLRIKAFYGNFENAVKTQIWTAIAVYVLVANVKKRLGLEKSLNTILQILSLSLFEKEPILSVPLTQWTPSRRGRYRKTVAVVHFLTGHYCPKLKTE
jgi:hypothetical protein